MTKLLSIYYKSFVGLSADVWLLSLISFINRAGTTVIPFISVFLTSQMGYSVQEAGYVLSAWGAGSLVGAILGGYLTDRFGYYPVMFWSLFLSGFAMSGLVFVEGLWNFAFAIFCVTVIADAYRPASMASLGAYSKFENRTRSMSLLRLAINLGFSVGPAVGGLIIAGFGYDWIFIIEGITATLAGLSFILLLKNKPDGGLDTLEKEDKQAIGISPYTDPPFVFFVFLMFLTAIGFMQLFSTMPIFFKEEIKMSELQIGLILGFNGFLIFLLEMPIIYLLENYKARLRLITFGTLLFGMGYLFFELTNYWIYSALVAMVLFTVGEIIHFPISSTIALNRSTPNRRGQYMGFYGISFSVAFIVSPTLSTFIIEKSGYQTLWFGLTLLSVLTALGYYLLARYMNRSQKRSNYTEI